MSVSTPPSSPPPSSLPPAPQSNAKYLVLGLLLLLGAGAAAWAMLAPSPPQPVPTGPASTPPVVRRPTLGDDDFEIPTTEDAAVAAPTAAEPTKRRPTGGSWGNCSGEVRGAAAVMATYNTQIRNCYERALKSNSTLQGNMTLRLRVASNGQVDATQATGSLGERDVFACVRAVADRIHFANVQGGSCAEIEIPFAFSPRN